MKFSLIVATVGRTLELNRFLLSLQGQSYKNFEIIIVDQNTDDRLEDVINPFMNNFLIRLLKSSVGLSHARNVGLSNLTGDIVAFPDDDCWYPPNLLCELKDHFEKNPNVFGFIGKPVDAFGNTTIGRFYSKPGYIKRRTVWRQATSFTLFFRTQLVRDVGKFDEELGLGSGTPWGSAEDIDYPLRAIKLGYILYYNPQLLVGHLETRGNYDFAGVKKGHDYGAGLGRVLRKHNYSFLYILYYCFRPLVGLLIALLKGNFRKMHFHLAVFRGRLKGWNSKFD